HDHEANFAIFKARHGRRQKPRIEEDVRLDGAVAQMVEFIAQFEARRRAIDRQLARYIAAVKAFLQLLDGFMRHTALGKFRNNMGCISACRFFKQRFRGHYKVPSEVLVRSRGMRMNMVICRVRDTAAERSTASISMAMAVETAAPVRPNCGISTRLRMTLTASVAA